MILLSIISGSTSNRKKLRFGHFPQIEENRENMGQTIPLSGELLKQKAMQISHEFDNTSRFVASNGWLKDFAKGMIYYLRIFRESLRLYHKI